MRVDTNLVAVPAAIKKQGYTLALEVELAPYFKEVPIYAARRDEILEDLNEVFGDKVKTKVFPVYKNGVETPDHPPIRFRIYCVDRSTVLQAKLRIRF